MVRVKSSTQSGLTAHEQALLDAGKKMMGDSISVGIDFCKTMMATSTTAIGVYFGLFALITPKDYRPVETIYKIGIVSPALLFLIASAIFAWGYFPTREDASLNSLRSIQAVREGTIRRRALGAQFGFAVFAIAVVSAICAVAAVLFTRPPLTGVTV